MKLKKRILSVLGIGIALFIATTALNPNGGGATGFSRFRTYGWPSDWLTVSTRDTTQWVNEERIPGKKSLEGLSVFSWPACIASLAISLAASLVLHARVIVKQMRRTSQQGVGG